MIENHGLTYCKYFLFAFVFFLYTVSLNAQINPDIKELESYIKERIVKDQIPGMLVAASHKGKLIYTKSFGMADLEHRTPVTDSTVFEIGSISKQFTAALIVMLEEEKYLVLTTQFLNISLKYLGNGMA